MVYCFLMKSFTVVQPTPSKFHNIQKQLTDTNVSVSNSAYTDQLLLVVVFVSPDLFCIFGFAPFSNVISFNLFSSFFVIVCLLCSLSISLSRSLCLCALLYRCLNIICCYVSKVDDAVAYFVSIYFIFSSLFQFFVFWMFLFFFSVSSSGCCCRLPFARRFASCACATLFGNCLSVREYMCVRACVLVCVCASVTVGQVIELERRQVTCGLLSSLLPPPLLLLRSCYFFRVYFSVLMLALLPLWC